MKKLLLFGIIFTLITAAASAQQASGENFRHHRMEESYRNGESNRHDMRRFEREKRRSFHDRRFNRRERHRMYRHERRHFRHFRHHRHHHFQ